MTSSEFIDELLVHFAKRHVSDEAEAKWLRDMIASVRGTDHNVLRRAYDLVIAEHTERAFPLPAVLKRYIERAAAQVYPDSERNSGGAEHRWPQPARWIDPREEKQVAKAQAWQAGIIRHYGSWAAYHRATRRTPAARKAADRPAWLPPERFPLARKRRIRQRRKAYDRVFMEAMMRNSPNLGLHVDHRELARRITGERDE